VLRIEEGELEAGGRNKDPLLSRSGEGATPSQKSAASPSLA
jgi:hypothetical protein